MTNYIAPKDVAKLVRKELKNEFPGIKFSVRCSRGSAIDVSWIDGPRLSEVESKIGHFRAGTFDGMTDCFEYSGAAYGNRFIFCHRDPSPEVRAEIERELCEVAGVEVFNGNEIVSAGVVDGKIVEFVHPNEYAGTIVREAFHKRAL